MVAWILRKHVSLLLWFIRRWVPPILVVSAFAVVFSVLGGEWDSTAGGKYTTIDEIHARTAPTFGQVRTICNDDPVCVTTWTGDCLHCYPTTSRSGRDVTGWGSEADYVADLKASYVRRQNQQYNAQRVCSRTNHCLP